MKLAYDESELVQNRTSLLIFGGTMAERHAWAEEAQRAFPDEGALVEVTALTELPAALARKGGVVYLPDVVALGGDAQAALMRCLQHQEERPKLIIGLLRSTRAVLDDGAVREDLHYRLKGARVDLGSPDVQAAIKRRRAEQPAPGKSRLAEAVRTPRAAAKVKPPSHSRR